MEQNVTSSDETAATEIGRILIADDDPAILRLVATILEKENYKVITDRDGRGLQDLADGCELHCRDPRRRHATHQWYGIGSPDED